MSKNRYRANVSYSYDFETDKDHAEAQIEAQEALNALTTNYFLNKKQVRLEKLKQINKLRLGEFTIDEVLPYVSREEKKREYKVADTVYSVRMDSSRYFVFRENIRCAACGLEGTKFILEQSPDDKNPHFNLYAVENGHNILMTKDHIHAKSYGGVDVHSNFQTLCSICNNLKGSSNITLDKIKELRRLYNENKNLPRKRFHKLLEKAKDQFKIPHATPHVPRKNRKAYLAQLKSKENAVVTNMDLRIWRLNNGGLVGKSVYEQDLEDASAIASVRIGTILIPTNTVESKVIVKLDGEDCEIYQGYLEILKGE